MSINLLAVPHLDGELAECLLNLSHNAFAYLIVSRCKDSEKD
jgi:hypothetical protein